MNYATCPTCGHDMTVDDSGFCECTNPECGLVGYVRDLFDGDENIDAYEAALLWRGSGEDEDMTFGYSEDELRDAL